ncbi:TetR/AcrR family transcriptional regulator [Colwellia sp. 4_MG-2023]|jgi:AcrR family transcriptional regulator|uniref:TetR/AcrR family transcriptional regulator n=1 Tax=unclassified Colwellia TaxID=196834 RepID=UPI001C0A6426|nr:MULTISPECIES: TetR/AcrR family transcriptional regulator [unclassified Colwellia]MBU2926334.1 TetR/AcrR family transcriptional regulator [Colwellia sp. C2M11]MDO6506560.1 TetR/AcrR family transcriptional regulator [Colwellia sp. 5_MG-2023]MDO6555047.1 TetR/AcrR family transcriptional regulator [Colwellia sp. 4_MG-2023]MDO6651772.1 TetR/AcrR family transcriptional regulator [Colwellia sp. 3_MG-2023]MDO6665317.1 TetR/AcrR family transcriptional regulator [Colwellia sp. 2_MG-2023]
MKEKSKRQTDPAIAQARREQVLCAAADCFRRKGYHGAGMAEISKTAGMSAGHIYNYFASKEAIIESIIEQDMETMFSIFQEFEDQSGDLVTILIDGLDHAVDHHSDVTQRALNLEMFAEAARNDKVSEQLQKSDCYARNKMRSLLVGERSLIKDLSEKELESRIEVMFSMISGITLRRALNPSVDKETILIALRPAMRVLLMPFTTEEPME